MTRRDHFERFEGHTQLKHFLLGAYLKQWATILVRGLRTRGHRGLRLWFVDGMAGAGRDRAGAPGSPVIASEIALQVNAQHFEAPLAADEGMKVVAFEADTVLYRDLVANLSPYTAPSAVAIAYRGSLPERLDQLLDQIGTDPVLFFIDPFGVDGLDASILPRLLTGPRAEILLLFSDEGAVRLAGKAGAVVPTREVLLEERQHEPSLLGAEFDSLLAQADRLAVDKVLAGHASNARAAEILNVAFGGDWWQKVIQQTPVEGRQGKFIELYEQVLRQAGAVHVLRFDVTTEHGRHKYTLLHASKHKRAFAAMKDAMHRARDQRPSHDTRGLFEASDDLENTAPLLDSGADLGAVAANVASHFAGREVRWTEERYTADTVKAYARDSTPLLIHEFPILQRALKSRGFLIKAKPLTYRFPASTLSG